MASPRPPATSILAVLPFLVLGGLPLAVLRELRGRGMDIHLSYQIPEAIGYTPDPAEDFAAQDRLVDLTRHRRNAGLDQIEALVHERGIGLILQIGSPYAYAQLPSLKERVPELRLVDWLFNIGPHFHSFYYCAGCFDCVLVESQEMASRLFGVPGIGRVRRVSHYCL